MTIGLAAFLGGPLGACYALYYNFEALEQPDRAKWTWIIGGGLTLFLIVGLLGLPQEAAAQLPAFMIPVVTVCAAVGTAHYFQGTALELQQDERLPAAPMWRALLIAVLCMGLTVLVAFLLSFIVPNTHSTPTNTPYKEQLDSFYTNETESMTFYDLLEANASDSTLLQELERNSIPRWKENIQMVEAFLAIEGLEDAEGDLPFLLEYAQLRLAIFENSRLFLLEDSGATEALLDSLYVALDTVQARM